MSWTLTGLGVALAIVLAAGAALALCRRYRIGWQWGTRNIWTICEEWRQRLSWLWAPREEKVGLVKAQHPTAQTIPGLYRQSGNTSSQHLLHSDSDLRLDAQGAFTRFEAVDRDLHPPLGNASSGNNAIPPQPLRPAPQPKSTVRPRPSPLQTTNTLEYLKMDSGPAPLTPPPTLQQRITSSAVPLRGTGPSVFLFQSDAFSSTNNSFNQAPTSAATGPNLYHEANQFVLDQEMRYNHKNDYNQLHYHQQPQFDESRIRYTVQGAPISEIKLNSEELKNAPAPYGSYDIVQRSPRHFKGGSQAQNSSTMAQNAGGMIIYGESISKMFQQEQQQEKGGNQIEMIPLKSSSGGNESYVFHTSPSKTQRITQYIQSLPDHPMNIFDSNHLMRQQQQQQQQQQHEGGNQNIFLENEDHLVDEGLRNGSKNGDDLGSISPVPPPPPAPPDPPSNGSIHRKNSTLTTGEKIFSALRSVTSQSYIDASEFYNSVLSSAQQVQRFKFPQLSSRSPNDAEENCSNPQITLQPKQSLFGSREESDTIDQISRRSSDLYSPELNLEAHRTAQEVYNSLQDPPASPLLLKDLSQDSYPYMSDPSFTRTSEDIFNSLEQRRKSMERLNGIHELVEEQTAVLQRRRNSHDLYAALEEAQMERRVSQSLEECLVNYSLMDLNECHLNNRRGSQSGASEPEIPTDDSNLKRAVSCESLCSDTSVVLNDIEEVPIVGHVCVGLEHERWGGRGTDCEGDLAVSVLEARDLVASDGSPAQDTFARVCLLPDRQTHVQTRLYRSSPSPSYQEKFLFPLDGGPVGRTLLVEIFSVEVSLGGGASLLGEASLRLGPTPRAPATTWLPLTGNVLPTPHLGELMFSLSYLPTAERLTLVVVKARNLKGSTPLPGDFFVKVYLLQQGKKMHKKKTSVKKGEKSPIFNEAIIFNVPAHVLQTIQLRLTVAEANNEQGTKAYSVGHVLIGATSTGRALAHWRQMLTALRRPVAMWHPLRK